MKVLTLYQPYATLVAVGAKRIETRSWSTKYRGPLAIHVSKHKEIDHKLWWSEPFATALEGTLVHIGPSEISILGKTDFTTHQILTKNLHLGCVIATCELVDIKETDDFWFDYIKNHPQNGWKHPEKNWYFTSNELAFGDFSSGRFLWFLDNVKLLPEPIPARGARGLWNWEYPKE